MGEKRKEEWWFRQKYYLTDNGIILSEDDWCESIDPMDFYGKDIEGWEDLYIVFANLNIDDKQEIIGFCNKFGLLGHVARNIQVVHTKTDEIDIDNGVDTENVIGIYSPKLNDWDRPVPLTNFGVSTSKNAKLVDEYLRNGSILTPLEVQKLVGEKIRDFISEQRKFTCLLELYCAINQKNSDNIKRTLYLWEDITAHSQSEYISDMNGYGSLALSPLFDKGIDMLMRILNEEFEKRSSLNLAIDRESNELTREIHWKKDSLLTALYFMFISDSLKGIKVKKCSNCNRFYKEGRPETKYCSYSCQNKAKTKRYRLSKKIHELYNSHMALDLIAAKTKQDMDTILEIIQGNNEKT